MNQEKQEINIEAKKLTQDEKNEKLIVFLSQIMRENDVLSFGFESYKEPIPKELLPDNRTGVTILTVRFMPREKK